MSSCKLCRIWFQSLCMRGEKGENAEYTIGPWTEYHDHDGKTTLGGLVDGSAVCQRSERASLNLQIPATHSYSSGVASLPMRLAAAIGWSTSNVRCRLKYS